MKQADTILSGGTILTMDGQGTIIPNGALAITGDRITDLGPATEINTTYRANLTLDTTGKLIMPGLINAHSHAAMTHFRGLADDLELMDWLNNYIFPAEARFVDREFAYLGTLLACAEMIRSGTTTFCDMYIFEDEVARAAQISGMRCLVGEVLFDFPSPNAKTPQEGLDYTRYLLEKWGGDPLVDVVVEPHALYTCSENLLRQAASLAQEFRVPIGTHLLETRGERAQIRERCGKEPLALLEETGCLEQNFIAFHGVWLTEQEQDLLALKGSAVIHNPESNMKLASGIAPIPDILARGIAVGLGTDGCASNNNLDLFQEMDTTAKLHKVHRLDPTVMDAPSVLRLATCEGARALGLASRVGTLAPDMQADIITIDINKPHLTPLYNPYSHVVYAAGGADVDTVIIAGRIVMRARELLTIEVDSVLAQAREISERIAAGLGVRRGS